MSKLRNRLIACMMAVAMTVSMLSVPAYAEEVEADTVTETIVTETEAVETEAAETEAAEALVTETVATETVAADNTVKEKAADAPKTELKKQEPEFGKEVLGYAVPLQGANRLRSAASTLSTSTTCPSPAQAQSIMYSLKSQYPEGMRYTNDDYYGWKGGIFSGGYGCAGFAFMLSDAAFGDLPARQIDQVTIGMLHSGDVLRVYNNTHSVMVMEVYSDHIVLAEGNYNSSVHWGRTMSAAEVAADTDYMLTRYPVGFFGEAFAIHYDLNGADGSMADQMADKGIATPITSVIPSRFGYEFKGWSTSKTATTAQYKPGDSITVTAETTLYAVWSKAVFPKLTDNGVSTKTVTISEVNEKVILEFVPSVSAKYTFESSGDLDPQLTLYSDSFEQIGISDDDGESYNFKLEQELTAGRSYYMEFFLYDGGTGSFLLTVTREGADVDPTPTDPEPEDQELILIATRDVNIQTSYGRDVFEFTPFESGHYIFESFDNLWNCDPKITIYSDADHRIGQGDSGGSGVNFRTAMNLVAGHTYLLETGVFSNNTGSFSYNISLNPNYSVEAGHVHRVSSSAQKLYSYRATCQNDGWTEGGFCSCGEPLTPSERIPKSGHSFTKYYYNGDATTETDGTETASCDYDCGETDTRTAVGTRIPVIGNEFPVQVDVNIEVPNQISEVVIVPDKTAKYTFESEGGFDTYIEIQDEDGNLVDYDDDTGEDLNFQISTILEAGKTYSVYAFFYSDGTGSFSYYITRSDKNPFIPSAVPTSVEMKFEPGEVAQYYYFTPSKTDTYKFELFGVAGEDIFVCDGNSVEDDIDCGGCYGYIEENNSLATAVELEAGVRYRVYVYRYMNEDTGKTFKLNVSSHTHSKAIHVPATAPTWTTKGNTEGWYCDCGLTMVEPVEIPKKTVSKPVLASATMAASGVTVKWNAVSGTEAYRVFYKEAGGSWTKAGDTTATSYTVPNAKFTSGKTYYFTVRCITKDGKTYISSFDTTGKSVVYLSPIKPTVTNASTGITVKWTKVAGATGYYVYRKTGSGSYTRIKTITSNSTVSFTDTAIAAKNGTGYTYAVRAYKGSFVGSFTAVSTIRLSSVSMSSLTNIATRKMTAKWTKNAKAAGYQIQYSTSSTFASGNKTVTVSGYSTLSKTITSLTKGKTYYVRVRAYKKNSAGTAFYSAWSGKKSVKISR